MLLINIKERRERGVRVFLAAVAAYWARGREQSLAFLTGAWWWKAAGPQWSTCNSQLGCPIFVSIKLQKKNKNLSKARTQHLEITSQFVSIFINICHTFSQESTVWTLHGLLFTGEIKDDFYY